MILFHHLLSFRMTEIVRFIIGGKNTVNINTNQINCDFPLEFVSKTWVLIWTLKKR